MDLKVPVFILLTVCLFFFHYFYDTYRDVNIEKELTKGISVPYEPIQEDIKNGQPFSFNEYSITPLARYDITARILLIDWYRFSPGSDISPWDFSVGWQQLSDYAVASRVAFQHGYRSHVFWYKDTLPISVAEINLQSSNMHLIPSSKQINERLASFHQYDIVRLKGKLVAASKSGGWSWSSSLTRTDTGQGACELMWVEDAEYVSR